MIKIIGVVLDEDYHLVGYIVDKDGERSMYSKESILNEAKYHTIGNSYIRREFIDNKYHIFIDLDEEGLSVSLTKEEAFKKYGPLK